MIKKIVINLMIKKDPCRPTSNYAVLKTVCKSTLYQDNDKYLLKQLVVFIAFYGPSASDTALY